MRVEIVTIGSELLLGFTTDTNAAHLARELGASGIRVVRRGTVGDDAREIADAVRDALERTGAVITTGGLGPTSDDMTKPAIAALFGRSLQLDEAIVALIERRFASLGLKGPMPLANRQQAMIPEGARVLANRHGTAPGIWLEDDAGRWVAMLPGVPREMRGMLADTLLPLLRERAGGPRRVVRSRTVRTTGIGESALFEALGELGRQVNGLPVAYLPGWAGVDLRLTVADVDDAEADRVLRAAAGQLRERAGAHVYGDEDDDLASVVLEQCRGAKLRLATAESCTGGMLGSRITAIPGSSEVYIGGVIAYADEVKVAELGVPADALREHGAVSDVVARAMARGARSRFGTDIGVGITGIAGPGGGSTEKPVGTVWIAVDARDRQRSLGRVYVGDREEVRRRSCQSALDMIRRMLSDPPR